MPEIVVIQSAAMREIVRRGKATDGRKYLLLWRRRKEKSKCSLEKRLGTPKPHGLFTLKIALVRGGAYLRELAPPESKLHATPACAAGRNCESLLSRSLERGGRQAYRKQSNESGGGGDSSRAT